jgi:diguanylate cyclase (GGDEF)-like protein
MTAKRRKTFGVLLGPDVYQGSHPFDYHVGVLRGIRAAARDQDINLLVACGINRGIEAELRFYPAWPIEFSPSDFVPVGPENTDGLLIFTPLFFKEQIQYLRELREQGFPVFFSGSGFGTPMIHGDSEGGMHQAVRHLAGHGHRAIAFVAGFEGDGDSESRLKAYREVVRVLDLTDDPRLVEFGQHVEGGGYDAMMRILQSGVKFSAVACSNDDSAVGALRAIKEAGLRIPWDVAVTGFDDNIDALAQIPPLTSVHYPQFETGFRALILLSKRLEYGPDSILEDTSVSCLLVPRQSCGCIPKAVDAAMLQTGTGAAPSKAKIFNKTLARKMMEPVVQKMDPDNIQNIGPLCDRLLESFLQSLQDGNPTHFEIGLVEVLQQIETMDEDAHTWQAAISILRDGIRVSLAGEADPQRRECAEDLVHQARTLVSESEQRRSVRIQLQQTRNEEAMGRLTARLLSSLDEEQVYSTLEDGLSKVGVRSGYVALFEPQGDDPAAGSRIRTYQKEAPPLRFTTRQFPPAGLYPDGEPFSLALLPLFFQEEKMGYVAFDGENLDPLATLVAQIASALKSAELHNQVLELSLTDGLTGVHNRRYFEMFLQKEVERGIRYKRRLSTIMIDIDHFKQYNDSFGHPAGDDALRKVAEDIQSGARRGLDVISRYGGEEFAVILPETEAEGARIVAENIRRNVESDSRFQRKLSVSLGIGSLSGEQLIHADLVEQADRALYQAKEQGRNRTVAYEEWMQDSAHAKGEGAS